MYVLESNRPMSWRFGLATEPYTSKSGSWAFIEHIHLARSVHMPSGLTRTVRYSSFKLIKWDDLINESATLLGQSWYM